MVAAFECCWDVTSRLSFTSLDPGWSSNPRRVRPNICCSGATRPETWIWLCFTMSIPTGIFWWTQTGSNDYFKGLGLSWSLMPTWAASPCEEWLLDESCSPGLQAMVGIQNARQHIKCFSGEGRKSTFLACSALKMFFHRLVKAWVGRAMPSLY